jgi:hypothetical protein
MIQQNYTQICNPSLLKGAIENNEYHGFKQDYHVLWCLLKKYNPKSVFEIGTNLGTGTNIICHALPQAKVYSLDLPTELAHVSLQHPISEGKGDNVGSKCTKPYTQLRGDSMQFDYSKYHCEAAYVDGEHSTKNVTHETTELLKVTSKIIIFHDTDMPEVMEGINNAISCYVGANELSLCRVVDTRVSYILINERSRRF